MMMRVLPRPVDVRQAEEMSRPAASSSASASATADDLDDIQRARPHPERRNSRASSAIEGLYAINAKRAAPGLITESIATRMPHESIRPSLQFDIEAFQAPEQGTDAESRRLSPETRAMLNTAGVDVVKNVAAAFAGWGLQALLAPPDGEDPADTTLAQSAAITLGTILGAAGAMHLAMKAGKMVVSYCAYDDDAAAQGEASSASQAGRTCISANLRRILTTVSGATGATLALTGHSPLTTAGAQTILAAANASVIGSGIDHLIRPWVTTYKTSSDPAPQASMAVAKTAASAFDLGGPGPMGPVVNLFTRAMASPALTMLGSQGGIKGEVVVPADRKPFREMFFEEAGKALSAAGAAAMVSVTKAAIDRPSSRIPKFIDGSVHEPGTSASTAVPATAGPARWDSHERSIVVHDNFAATDLAKNLSDFANKVAKPVLDKRIAAEGERRKRVRAAEELTLRERRERYERADGPDIGEMQV